MSLDGFSILLKNILFNEREEPVICLCVCHFFFVFCRFKKIHMVTSVHLFLDNYLELCHALVRRNSPFHDHENKLALIVSSTTFEILSFIY